MRITTNGYGWSDDCVGNSADNKYIIVNDLSDIGTITVRCNCNATRFIAQSYGVDDCVGNSVYDNYIIECSDIKTRAIRCNSNFVRTKIRRYSSTLVLVMVLMIDTLESILFAT